MYGILGMGGPQPSREIMENLPEEISQDMAIEVWRKGYVDGREDKEMQLFPLEVEYVQFVYDDGRKMGAADRKVQKEINLHASEHYEDHDDDKEEPPEPRLYERVRAFIKVHQLDIGMTLTIFQVIGILLTAYGVLRNKSRGGTVR